MELIAYQKMGFDHPIRNPILQKVVDYLATNGLDNQEKGTHHVTDDFFYNIIEMETTTPDNRVWESHRDFYDVHVILKGKEKLQYNHLSHMHLCEYDSHDDWQQMTGESLFDIILEEGMLLLLDPNDAHKTGLIVDEAQPLRKVVFKVRI